MRRDSYSLVHDNTDSIIEQRLAEDDGVELGVDLVLIEYREDGDWVCSG